MKTIRSPFRARQQYGFTLIELMIVVVIIGVLVAIAAPKFAHTKEKAYLASMKSDLRNLVTAEEMYFEDNMTYTADKSLAGLNYIETTAVTVAITVNAGPPMGYSAISTHTATAATCAIFMAVVPVAPATNEGEVRCA
jgi:prepilin-type N-terminal cleavage/methylation domain-containing protein